MTQRLPEIEVSAATLRRAFNESQLPDRIKRGELRAVFRWDNVLAHPELKGLPAGTRSQIIRYMDDEGEMLVLVHQYLLPDGTIGGSGMPDPKRLRVGDEIWVATQAGSGD